MHPSKAEVQTAETSQHTTTGDVRIDVADDSEDEQQDNVSTAVPINDAAATVKTQSGKHSLLARTTNA